jgi:hypothetical protein
MTQSPRAGSPQIRPIVTFPKETEHETASQ